MVAATQTRAHRSELMSFLEPAELAHLATSGEPAQQAPKKQVKRTKMRCEMPVGLLISEIRRSIRGFRAEGEDWAVKTRR
jgi:hypothetical protein